MPIIALTGKKRHGKSTAAKALVKRGFTLVNFADPVRRVCHEVYGLTYEEMDEDHLKEKPLDRWPYRSPREIMQKVGTEMFRTYLPATWTEKFKRTVRELRVQGQPNIVCGDLRFLNEDVMLTHELDATTVRIIDPRRPVSTDTHASELEMDQIVTRLTFLNDSSIEALEAKMLAHFMERR